MDRLARWVRLQEADGKGVAHVCIIWQVVDSVVGGAVIRSETVAGRRSSSDSPTELVTVAVG